MVNVEVKVPKLVLRSARWKAAAETALHALGEFARDRLISESRKTLHSTALDYEHGLTDPRSIQHGDGEVTIRLVGKAANALERGYGGFDMKPGFLAKAKKHSAEGAPYVDIPFRHGQPGSTVLKPMSAGASADMADAVKKLGAAANKQKVQLKTRTSPGPEQPAHHKVGLYDQLTRIPKVYKSTAQVQYRTFRRVSAKSDPRAWMHPGFSGVNAFPTVAREVRREAPKVLSYYAKTMGV